MENSQPEGRKWSRRPTTVHRPAVLKAPTGTWLSGTPQAEIIDGGWCAWNRIGVLGVVTREMKGYQ